MSEKTEWIDESAEQRPNNPEDDARYSQALRYLQTGEAQKAWEVLAQLAETYPEDEGLKSLVDEAALKAKLDTHTHIRSRRSMGQWNRILLYALIASAIVVLAMLGVRSIRLQIAPMVAETQAQQQLEQLRTEGEAFLQADQYDDAEARFYKILTQVPDDAQAQTGLSEVAKQREVEALYEEACQLQEAGDYELALAKLMDLSVMAPQYRDVQSRITTVVQSGQLEQLYVEAESAYADGQAEVALAKYTELSQLNPKYQPAQIATRLFDLHMSIGRSLLEQVPPQVESVQTALDHFTAALSLQPRQAEAVLEQRLAQYFLEGQTLYSKGSWDAAISRLRTVYDQRADYLGTTVVDMLYDAYVRSGDTYSLNQDLPLAYEQYRKAAELPVADQTLAQGRLATIALKLTPTSTPTVTPTPTQTPLPTMTPLPTTVPTPQPLALYHNRILFYSDDEEDTALWSLDPSTGQRVRLGDSKSLIKEFEALVEQYTYSPDGRYHAYVADASQSSQIFTTRPADEQGKALAPLQLTHLKVCYQPAWSPDGSQVVFVSEQDQSDDIWVVNVDGTEPNNLTENKWPWDKHPSWSPDGKRIVFWSNREGLKQLYVMDANGQNVENISNSTTDDYDPVWVR